MTGKRTRKVLICLLVFFGMMPSWIFAEIVKEVAPDGTLTFASGKKVALVGIRLDAEGVSVLKAIAVNQDVKVRGADIPAGKSGEYVYAYVHAKSIKFPALADELARYDVVMLNKFLIAFGAARVAEGQVFDQKKEFLKLQKEAKKKGEGVWSYEVS